MTRVGPPALVLLAAALPLTAFDLGRRVLGTNDEARFPLLARDILAHGTWTAPALNGEPYLLKPPLTAWLIALASWPSGQVTLLTAAVPSAVAAIALAFIVWALGRELFGPQAGLVAGLAALTSQGVAHFARIPLPDMPMTCFVTASLWMFARMVRSDTPAPWAWLGFAVFAAIAFWSKGPAGFLLPTVVALVIAPRLVLGRALVVLGLLVAPWWIVTLFRSGQMSRVVVNDYVLWYVPLTADWSSVSAPFGHALAILLPWTLVLPFAVYAVIRRVRAGAAEGRALVFVLAWIGVTFGLLALSHEQRFRYYLPMVPPVALLAGWWLSSVAGARRHALVVAGCLAVGALMLGVQHAQLVRHNVVNEYPRFRSELDGSPGTVAAWDVHHLALAFDLGRPVAPIRNERELVATLTASPPGTAVVKGTILAAACRRDAFDVALRGRLADREAVVVKASPRLAEARGSCQ